MRAVYPYDLDRAALAVMVKPLTEQKRLAQMLVWRAHIADKYRKRLGQLHPKFGSGTLGAAAWQELKAKQEYSRPNRCDGAYLKALSVVIEAVMSAKDEAL